MLRSAFFGRSSSARTTSIGTLPPKLRVRKTAAKATAFAVSAALLGAAEEGAKDAVDGVGRMREDEAIDEPDASREVTARVEG